MMKYASCVLRHYPKAERALTDMIRQKMYHAWDLIGLQIYQKNRVKTLQELDWDITSLKRLVRLSADLKFIGAPEKDQPGDSLSKTKKSQYEIWSKMLVDEGKEIGGMLKTAMQAR